MARLTIGEVSRRTGLATSAIRYYERSGLIEPAPKESGRRVYAPEILDRLAVIALAKGAGLSLAETRDLLVPAVPRQAAADVWRIAGDRKRAELDARIAALEEMKGLLARLENCECPSLDDCGRAYRAGTGC